MLKKNPKKTNFFCCNYKKLCYKTPLLNDAGVAQG